MIFEGYEPPKFEYAGPIQHEQIKSRSFVEVEIVLPQCKRDDRRQCNATSDFYSRKDVFEENHANLFAFRIIAVVIYVEGFEPNDKISLVPLDSTSAEGRVIPLTFQDGLPLQFNVRWSYTRNWKKILLLEI